MANDTLTHTLLDEGQQMDLTSEQLAKLLEADLIYWCPDHDGAGFYHIEPDHTWLDVEAVLDA